MNEKLHGQLVIAGRRLLNEQNRDPFSPAYGCFDRRFWGWKLVDYPEATFQRGVYPLAWLLRHQPQAFNEDLLKEAVLSGLRFAAAIQHPDGSFDQAFPHEHSFGATAFLLHPLLYAYQTVEADCNPELKRLVESCLSKAADFLCQHDETHGHIANHLAGAVLSLLAAANAFQKVNYRERAEGLLNRILNHQSSEGWFLEYEGADPGYQTLCMYYLAQVDALWPDFPRLRDALDRSLSFLKWFVHPDGSFGGEYGSRRTAVYYPGGIAILAGQYPQAARMAQVMGQAVADEKTISPTAIDIGNLIPLSSALALSLEAAPDSTDDLLPCEAEHAQADFPEAGLYVRSTARHYVVIGASNGGTVKVFDRANKCILWNDGGYVGRLEDGSIITSQMTGHDNIVRISPDTVSLTVPFYYISKISQTPFQFLALRILNLTVMRSLALGNWAKALLVRLLITGKRQAPLSLTRVIQLRPDAVVITDTLNAGADIRFASLSCGKPFVSIHMASSQYLDTSIEQAASVPGKHWEHLKLMAGTPLQTETTL
jgi:hypothetical protein